MQTYKYEQVHLCTFAFPSELYYNCYKLLGDIKIGIIATYKCIYIYLILQGKTPFYEFKNVHVDQMQ